MFEGLLRWVFGLALFTGVLMLFGFIGGYIAYRFFDDRQGTEVTAYGIAVGVGIFLYLIYEGIIQELGRLIYGLLPFFL
jgi:zinc transporter ZupT